MFTDDGLWPCKCNACKHEWYSSIAAMRADGEVICTTCSEPNSIPPGEFDSAVLAARSGRYDFSYLEHIPAEFQSGAPAARAA